MLICEGFHGKENNKEKTRVYTTLRYFEQMDEVFLMEESVL